ncbi:hypothetical protein AGMMS50268_00040 [Spirochaetia bacterium]|nr:hypothetical protein AGMMS50268_00040 [Spirochaetia bacterium]
MDIQGIITTVIGYASHIADLFGKASGIRIGGTSVAAIATLAAAKAVENKVPAWIKWLLYLAGGTMATGGIANIIQSVQGAIQKWRITKTSAVLSPAHGSHIVRKAESCQGIQ